jgi:hypothetical protein
MHNLLERAGGHYVDVTSGETKKQHLHPRRNRHPPRRNMRRRAEGEIRGMWNGKRMQRIVDHGRVYAAAPVALADAGAAD